MAGLKAGAKAAVTDEPLNLKGFPRDRAERRIRFIEKFVVAPHGKGGGKPMKLRPWQRDLARGAYSGGIRQALVSLPRGNGKSSLAAALGVAELFLEPYSPQVLIVASDQRQANIVLGMARRMIELSPELAERTQVYREKIIVPGTDGEMQALPADPAALNGWRPTLQIVDELHVVTDEVWEAVVSAAGKNEHSLTLAISTPAASEDSVMWRLVQHGRSGDDDSFFIKEYSAPEGCAIDDQEAWAIANPALGDFLAIDGLASAIRTMREPTARQLRLGQWVKGSDSWLPFGAWASCEDTQRTVDRRERIVLGFDGSSSGDTTALVGCTVGETPHIFVLGAWENPGRKDWRVPRQQVSDAVDEAFAKFNVQTMACDPWSWRSEIQAWADRHGARRVIEYDTSYRKRMAPATDKFYASVLDLRLTHDGDQRLANHIAHTKVTRTPQGDVVTKDARTSNRKIDLAIAAIIAHDLATNQKISKRRRAVGFN